ncbi:RNA polymerase sigma factor [Parapedobacter sp. 2B3]|uniref:RNA polymerase sigma factor n=1 Tax=Parapedobacter sp. 2B3 TaxID=3342381 RepID=UPI0035B61192
MKTYALLTDEVLADLVKEQDTYAYTELYQRYWGALHRFCHRLLRDEAQATDTVQDVFVHFWENAPQLELRFSLSSYLYGAARNQVIRYIRKEKVKASYLSQLDLSEGEFMTDEPLRVAELEKLVEQEIENLPPRMREVFELSRKAYLSHKEIADRLDISEGTVKKQVSNALRLLRAKLGCIFFLGVMQVIWWWYGLVQ